MTRSKARLALLALTVSCVVGGVAPAQAGANFTFFNCLSQSSGTWCDGRGNGSYDGEDSWNYMEGWDSGAETVEVCQRVYKPSTGNWLVGNSCSNNYVEHYYGNVQCVCYDAQVRHLTTGSYSINGSADSDWIE